MAAIGISGSLATAQPVKRPQSPAQPAPAAKDPCESKVVGLYGFVATGIVPTKQKNGTFRLLPIQELGQVVYKIDGTASARIKAVLNGATTSKALNGKYSVDPKTCAGSVTWADSDGPTWGFVVVSGGRELETIDARGDGSQENPAGAVVFTQKKM